MAKKYSVAIEQKIVDYYNQGISPYKMVQLIPELYGKRPSVIYDVLKRLGIKSHNPSPLTEQQKKKRRKYDVNDDYFEIIDTEHKAYWLGFLYADGYITTIENKIGIALSDTDKSHLYKFRDCIDSQSPIKDYVQTEGYNKGSPYSRIIITSEKMKKDLLSKGVLENKTNMLIFPDYTQVPKTLVRHFIRGYIDGDGSLTHSSVSNLIKITGTKEILLGIQKELKTNVALEQRYPERNVNNYSITIGGNIQVKRILKFLYENSTMYLERKYKRYEEICN